MRYVILFALLLMPVSALAMNDSIINYCFTTADPKACIQDFNADVQRHERAMQQEFLRAQLEQARIQANGMALFGAGNAFVNGMNQNLQNMQLPLVNTPAFNYATGRR